MQSQFGDKQQFSAILTIEVGLDRWASPSVQGLDRWASPSVQGLTTSRRGRAGRAVPPYPKLELLQQFAFYDC